MAAPFDRSKMECFGFEPEVAADAPREVKAPKNEDVVVKDIDPCSAFEAFAGAYLSTKNMNYDGLQYTPNVIPLSSLSLADDSRETPAGTYERLQKEIAAFKSEISGNKTMEGDVDISAILSSELTALEGSLSSTSKDPNLAPFLNANFPALPTDLKSLPAGDKAMNSSTLTKSFGDEVARFKSSLEFKEQKTDEQKAASGVTYEVLAVAPSSSANLDLVQIDKRITSLEDKVGEPGSAADGLGASFPDLVSGLVFLERQIAALEDPSKLEDKLRRIGGLTAELDVLKEQKQAIAGAKSNEYGQKIEKVYSQLGEWDTAARLLPGVLARLQSIKEVYTEGASVSSQIKELGKEQASVDAMLIDQTNALRVARQNLSDGIKQMEATLSSLDAAMAKHL